MNAAMCLTMTLCGMSWEEFWASADSSGTCGEHLNWTLSDSGTLTVSGVGNMTNYYTLSDNPWYDYGDAITKVAFTEAATSIGQSAFQYYSNLVSIDIPESVTPIEIRAFYGCSAPASLHSGKRNIHLSREDIRYVRFNRKNRCCGRQCGL